MADVTATFNYDADFSSAISEVQKLAREVGFLNSQFNAFDQASINAKRQFANLFRGGVGEFAGLRVEAVNLSHGIEDFGKALEKSKLKLRDYAREARMAFKENSNARKLAEDQVRRTRAQLIELGMDPSGKRRGMLVTPMTLDMSDMQTQLEVGRKQWDIFNKLVQDGSTHLINWGKNTQWAGRQLTVGLTVPMTMFASTTVKAFNDVDAELTRFQKVYGSSLVQTTTAATEAIRGQVQAVAVDIARTYGIAAKETAALSADLAATGLEGQRLIDSVKQTTRLAVLGELDRQDAMKTTLSLQNAFNMSTKQLAESIDFLNAVENQTSVSLGDLSEAIPKVGPVVRALGGDVKDLSVLLVAMKEGGINAAEGANALKSGLASLINPTKNASEVAKQYGIDLEGIVNKNKGKLLPTILEFQNSLMKLDELGKAKVIEQIFGKYQFARISALFDNLNQQGSQTRQVIELMGKSSKELAAIANSELKVLTESTSMRFKRSLEGIKASLLPLGEAIAKSVIPFMDKLTTLLDKLVSFGQSLPGPVKSFLKFAAGVTAIAGPLIMITGVLGNFLGYIVKGAMAFVNLGRKMAGLPVQQFEMLSADQIAAAKATDMLTVSIDRQKQSMMGLRDVLLQYSQTLASVMTEQAGLFQTGATPFMPPGTTEIKPGPKPRPRRRQFGGPIFRAQGGADSSTVPGYGEGDKVAALLEPGEFVINKKAAKKHKKTLEYINNVDAPRFSTGGSTYRIGNEGDILHAMAGRPVPRNRFSEAADAISMQAARARETSQRKLPKGGVGRFARLETEFKGASVQSSHIIDQQLFLRMARKAGLDIPPNTESIMTQGFYGQAAPLSGAVNSVVSAIESSMAGTRVSWSTRERRLARRGYPTSASEARDFLAMVDKLEKSGSVNSGIPDARAELMRIASGETDPIRQIAAGLSSTNVPASVVAQIKANPRQYQHILINHLIDRYRSGDLRLFALPRGASSAYRGPDDWLKNPLAGMKQGIGKNEQLHMSRAQEMGFELQNGGLLRLSTGSGKKPKRRSKSGKTKNWIPSDISGLSSSENALVNLYNFNKTEDRPFFDRWFFEINNNQNYSESVKQQLIDSIKSNRNLKPIEHQRLFSESLLSLIQDKQFASSISKTRLARIIAAAVFAKYRIKTTTFAETPSGKNLKPVIGAMEHLGINDIWGSAGLKAREESFRMSFGSNAEEIGSALLLARSEIYQLLKDNNITDFPLGPKGGLKLFDILGIPGSGGVHGSHVSSVIPKPGPRPGSGPLKKPTSVVRYSTSSRPRKALGGVIRAQGGLTRLPGLGKRTISNAELDKLFTMPGSLQSTAHLLDKRAKRLPGSNPVSLGKFPNPLGLDEVIRKEQLGSIRYTNAMTQNQDTALAGLSLLLAPASEAFASMIARTAYDTNPRVGGYAPRAAVMRDPVSQSRYSMVAEPLKVGSMGQGLSIPDEIFRATVLSLALGNPDTHGGNIKALQLKRGEPLTAAQIDWGFGMFTNPYGELDTIMQAFKGSGTGMDFLTTANRLRNQTGIERLTLTEQQITSQLDEIGNTVLNRNLIEKALLESAPGLSGDVYGGLNRFLRMSESARPSYASQIISAKEDVIDYVIKRIEKNIQDMRNKVPSIQKLQSGGVLRAQRGINLTRAAYKPINKAYELINYLKMRKAVKRGLYHGAYEGRDNSPIGLPFDENYMSGMITDRNPGGQDVSWGGMQLFSTSSRQEAMGYATNAGFNSARGEYSTVFKLGKVPYGKYISLPDLTQIYRNKALKRQSYDLWRYLQDAGASHTLFQGMEQFGIKGMHGRFPLDISGGAGMQGKAGRDRARWGVFADPRGVHLKDIGDEFGFQSGGTIRAAVGKPVGPFKFSSSSSLADFEAMLKELGSFGILDTKTSHAAKFNTQNLSLMIPGGQTRSGLIRGVSSTGLQQYKSNKISDPLYTLASIFATDPGAAHSLISSTLGFHALSASASSMPIRPDADLSSFSLAMANKLSSRVSGLSLSGLPSAPTNSSTFRPNAASLSIIEAFSQLRNNSFDKGFSRTGKLLLPDQIDAFGQITRNILRSGSLPERKQAIKTLEEIMSMSPQSAAEYFGISQRQQSGGVIRAMAGRKMPMLPEGHWGHNLTSSTVMTARINTENSLRNFGLTEPQAKTYMDILIQRILQTEGGAVTDIRRRGIAGLEPDILAETAKAFGLTESGIKASIEERVAAIQSRGRLGGKYGVYRNTKWMGNEEVLKLEEQIISSLIAHGYSEEQAKVYAKNFLEDSSYGVDMQSRVNKLTKEKDFVEMRKDFFDPEYGRKKAKRIWEERNGIKPRRQSGGILRAAYGISTGAPRGLRPISLLEGEVSQDPARFMELLSRFQEDITGKVLFRPRGTPDKFSAFELTLMSGIDRTGTFYDRQSMHNLPGGIFLDVLNSNGKLVLDRLFSTRGNEANVLQMIALAQMIAKENLSGSLTPSSSLTPYSARLANKLGMQSKATSRGSGRDYFHEMIYGGMRNFTRNPGGILDLPDRRTALEIARPFLGRQSGGIIRAQSGGGQTFSNPWVPGSGEGDKIKALLEPGEFVVNKVAAAKHGGMLNYINYVDAPRFQSGGVLRAQTGAGPMNLPGMKSGAAAGALMTLGFLPSIFQDPTKEASNLSQAFSKLTMVASSLLGVFSAMTMFKGQGGAGSAPMVFGGEKVVGGIKNVTGKIGAPILKGVTRALPGVATRTGIATTVGATGVTTAFTAGAMALGGAAILAVTAAIIKYKQRLDDAKKAAQQTFSVSKNEAAAYGIELKSMNDAMKENVDLNKQLGITKDPIARAGIMDPEKAKAVTESNKEMIKSMRNLGEIGLKSTVDFFRTGKTQGQAQGEQTQMLLSKYGALLSQGFSSQDAQEAVFTIAKAAGAMDAFARASEQFKNISLDKPETIIKTQMELAKSYKNMSLFSGDKGALGQGIKDVVASLSQIPAQGQYKAAQEFINSIQTLDTKQLQIAQQSMYDMAQQDFGKGAGITKLLKSVQEQTQGFSSWLNPTSWDNLTSQVFDEKKATKFSATISAAYQQGILSDSQLQMYEARIKADPASLDDLQNQVDAALAERDRIIKVKLEFDKTADINIEQINKEVQANQKAFQDAMDANQKLADKENERYANAQKKHQNFIKQKQKEVDAINRGADEYTKSLQKQEQADAFYANQRQTALGGLQALAGGDVLGFLQAREQAAAQAQQFGYQSEIDQINAKRDAAVQAKQDEIDKEQELADKEDEHHAKIMKNLEDKAKSLQEKYTKLITDGQTAAAAWENAKGNTDLTNFLASNVKEADRMAFTSSYVNYLINNPQATSADALNYAKSSWGEKNKTDLARIQETDKETKALARASGGYISGPGGPKDDKIPAMLSNGEYVIQADAVSSVGRGQLDYINKTGTIPYGGKEDAAKDESIYEKIRRRIFNKPYPPIGSKDYYPSGKKHSSRYAHPVDYLASAGTPVLALMSGTAINKTMRGSFGKHVILSGSEGTAIYAHLSGFGKKGAVNAGDTVGYVGNTGNSFGAHLHFEWSKLGKGNLGALGTLAALTTLTKDEIIAMAEQAAGLPAGTYNNVVKNGLIGLPITGFGARAHGGSMTMNKPYLVGENGPEVVMPYGSGGMVRPVRYSVPSPDSAMPEIDNSQSNAYIDSSTNSVYNISVDASGSSNPRDIANAVMSAIKTEENRRSFGRGIS